MSAVNRKKRKPRSKLYRSGLEDKVIADLNDKEVSHEYETLKIHYQKKPSKYTPDILLENGIVVEVKGYFDADDRAKHLLIQEQHPLLDIRFVFQSSSKRISKSSLTTYASWCEKHGFIYSDSLIPNEWINEETREEYYKQVLTYQKPKLRKTTI